MKNSILDYEQVNQILDSFSKDKKFIELNDLGNTEKDLPIRHFTVGNGKSDIVITGATHGSEIITTDFILKLMSDIKNNEKEWNNVLKEFTIHLIPMLNPEGYLISSCAVRKLIPRDMEQEEAEKICKKYYMAYRSDDINKNVKKEHLEMFENINYRCIPDKYENVRKSVKSILDKYADLPQNCLHIWSANANGVDIQANSKYNPKISQILNGEDIYMQSPRHNILNISHPGPINCPFDKEKGFKIEKETLAISNLLDLLYKKGKLFAYLNYHSTGSVIFQRPATQIENKKIKREDIFKKEITNYMLAKTYQEKTYKNSGLDENGNDKKESSKYEIYVNEANATSTNDMFRLKYPQNLLIELSGMGGNPIAPYGDIKENYKNTINSNLDSIKYTLKVASIAQMISESAYQVIKKFEGKVEYQEVTEVQDIIYKEFAKKIKSMQSNKEEKEIEENDR